MPLPDEGNIARRQAIPPAILRDSLDVPECGVFSVDRGYRYTSFNRAHAAVMKAFYGIAIALGDNFLDSFTVGHEREEAQACLDRALAGEQTVVTRLSRGSAIDPHEFVVSFHPICDGKGGFTGVIVVVREATAVEHPAENERWFHTIFEQAGVGVAEVDARTGRFIQVNPWIANFLGYSVGELLDGDVRRVTHPEDIPATRKVMEDLASGAIPNFTVEKRFVRRDGAVVWGRVTVIPLYTADNRMQSNLSIIQDITDRKADELRLHEEKTTLETLLRTIPDLVWLKDARGVYRFCNPRFEAFFGHPAAEIVGKTDFDFVERELADFFREHDRRAMEARQPTMNEEWVTFASDGHRELLETIKTPMYDGGGELLGVLGIARDITQKRQDQEQIRKLSEATEQSPVAVVITDRSGRIDYVNPRFATLTGYTAAEICGENIRILKSGTMPPDVYTGLWHTVQAGGTWRGEIQNRKKDGTLYWEAMSISPIMDEAGNLSHFVALKEDISERLRIEEELRKSEALYRSLFDNMLDGLAYCRMCFDAEGKPEDFVFLEVNEAFGRLTGLQEVVGKSISELLPGIRESDPQIFEIYGRVARTGQAEGCELFVARQNIWYSLSAYSPIPGHFVTVFDVITERKQAEASIKAQLEELRRWHAATLGRETRILDLKSEVNALAERLGLPTRYPSVADTASDGEKP